MRPLAFVLLAGVAFAQQQTAIRMWVSNWNVNGATVRGSVEYLLPPSLPPLITGSPFSAQQGEIKLFRDTAGRTRVERPPLVEINDPARGVLLVLDSSRKVAHRVQYPPTPPGVGAALPGGMTVSGRLVTPRTNAPGPPPPQVDHEGLGVETIAGVTAEGQRTTTTYPIGSIGNDRLFSVVQDEWRSAKLQLVIRSVTRDPRTGETKFELTNLSTTAPSARLFDPPADYKTVDAKVPFRIEFGAGSAK